MTLQTRSPDAVVIESDYAPIPRGDLPFGMPSWLGDNSRGRQSRPKRRNTVERDAADLLHTLIWQAPTGMNNSASRRPARFLLAIIDAGGTVPPALSLAAELVHRGHHVRVLADPTIDASAQAAGCAFSPWQQAPHFDTRAEQTALVAALQGENLIQAFRAVKGFAGKAVTGRYALDVIKTVREFPVDAILADGLPGILIGAPGDQSSYCNTCCTHIRPPTPGLPLVGTGWSPGDGVLGKARDKIAPSVVSGLLTLPCHA